MLSGFCGGLTAAAWREVGAMFPTREGMLLERRRERLADELARGSADGWLV